MRATRRLVRAVVALVALLVALVVAGLLFIQTDAFRERVRLFAVDRLREAVHGRVEVARLRGDLLRGVTLEGVSITGPAGEPFLEIPRLEVEYRIGGFLDQKIMIGDAVLHAPRITLVQDSTGAWNYLEILPFLKGGEEPDAPGGWGSVVRVRDLRIDDGTLGVTTTAEARAFGPLGRAPEVTRLNGRLQLDLTSGEEGQTRVAAEDLSFHVREPALDVRELDARATFTRAGMELERILLRTAATELAGRGTIRNLADPVFDLELSVDPLDLTELRRFYPGVPYEGTVRGRLALAGPAEDLELGVEDAVLQTPRSRIAVAGKVTTEDGPVVDAQVTLDPFDPADVRVLWGGYPLEEPLRGRLSVRGVRDRLAVGGGLAWGGTAADVRGTLGFAGREPTYGLSFTVARLDLEDVLHAPSWRSVVNGAFTLEGQGIGTGARAELGGAVRDSRILFYDVRAGAFHGRFRPGTPGAFEVDTFALGLPNSEVRGSGVLPYNHSLALDLAATSRNVQDFYPGIGPMPAARFVGEGRLEGPFSGIDLTLTARADSLVWKGLVTDSLDGTAVFTDLGRPTFQMALEGTGTQVDYLGPIRFETTAFQAGFAGDTMGVTVDVRLDTLRTAEGHLDIDFSGASPRIVLDRGTLRLRDQAYVVEEPSGFAFQDGVFRFDDFALVHDGERVTVDGTLRLDGAQDFTFALEGVSLDDFLALAGTERPMAGQFNGSGRVTGTDIAPIIEGEFSLAEGRLGGVEIHRFGGRIEYADRELELDIRLAPETAKTDTLESPGELVITGTFPVDLAFGAVEQRLPDRPIDLRIQSRDVDLSVLEAFVPRIAEARGAVELDIRLTGRPTEPRYAGQLVVRDGSFALGRRGVRYTGINGTARFDNDQITFEDVRVASPTGEARLAGRIALRELTLGDIEADLTARRFTLIDEEGKELVVDADIEIAGTTEAPSVTGRINVEQMEWPLPEQTDKDVIDLDEAILYVRAEGDTAQPKPALDVWRQTLLDLDVNIEDDAFLRSEKALIVLQGDLTIEKQRGRERPEMAGGLEVVRGFYADFGTQFEVTEGEVFFYGTPDFNPGVHIVAAQTVRDASTGQDVEITLTLGGTLENLTLNVTSVPEYEKSEVFSLMLFGTPSPGQGQQERFDNTIARVATRQAALPLQRALVSELNLDLLEISPGAGGSGTRLRIGKYISTDVFVTYTQGTGPQEESAFGIQYRLSRKWTIETQAGTRQFGSDIFYEFQY